MFAVEVIKPQRSEEFYMHVRTYGAAVCPNDFIRNFIGPNCVYDGLLAIKLYNCAVKLV